MTGTGEENSMASPERSTESLAPVSYLPWAAPEAVGETTPADVETTLLAAENVLTRRLRARSLSHAEAEGVLSEVGVYGEEADELLERYERLGYLDEQRLAEQIVHTHHERKGLGRSAVEAEMRRRQIDPCVIYEVLDTLDVDEVGPATALADQRARRMGDLDDATAERRLLGFLMRKGYSSSVSREAVKAALQAAGRSVR